MAKLIIRKGRTKPLWHGHPWIYAQAVSRREGEAQAGDVVDVVDSQGAFLGGLPIVRLRASSRAC